MNKKYVVFGGTEYDLNDGLVDAIYEFAIDIFEHQYGYDEFELMLKKAVKEYQEYYTEGENRLHETFTLDMLKSIAYFNIYACLNILLTRYSYRLKLFGKEASFSTAVCSYWHDIDYCKTLFVHDLIHIGIVVYSNKNVGDNLTIIITDNKHSHDFYIYIENSQIADYLSNRI